MKILKFLLSFIALHKFAKLNIFLFDQVQDSWSTYHSIHFDEIINNNKSAENFQIQDLEKSRNGEISRSYSRLQLILSNFS